jgi:VWFA-related protein
MLHSARQCPGSSAMRQMRNSWSLRGVLVLLAFSAVRAQQPPTFKSGVDLVRLDVTVVADDGAPVRDLGPDDFAIELNGQQRPVKSLQFIDYAAAPAAATTTTAPDFSTNTASAGRLTVVVVDEMSLVQGHEQELIESLITFLGRMFPQDRTALITLPGKTARVDFTSELATLREAAGRIRAWPVSARAPEPIRMDRRDGRMRTGFGPSTLTDLNPVADSLRAIVEALTPIDGPKSLVFIGDLPGGTTNLSTYYEFAQKAAEARVTLYAVRAAGVALDISTSTGINETADSSLNGLELIAGASGGVVLNAIARSVGIFDRIQRETTGSYVVGIEPLTGVPPDKAMKITVRVRRPGVAVRGPKQMLPPGRASVRKSAKATIGETLRQPRVATDLPLRLATYTARETGSDRLTLAIVTEVAGQSNPPARLTWGFEIREGHRVVADGFDQKSGEPSGATPRPGVLISSVSLKPGSYTLHYAVTDGQGRRGSVERPLNVALHGGAPISCSDLFVGEAVDKHFMPRVSFAPGTRQVVAFLELYSADTSRDVAVDFVLRNADGVVQNSGRVAAPPPDGSKRVVQATLAVDRLTPGIYHLSTHVIVDGAPTTIVRRSIVIGT